LAQDAPDFAPDTGDLGRIRQTNLSVPDSHTAPLRYFVSHNGEVKGPFDLDMIEAFILSGHYPRGVQIRAEGSNQWKSHSFEVKTAPPPLPPPLPQQFSQPVGSKPSGGVPKWALWGGGILGVFILMKMFSGGNTATPSSVSSSYAPKATPYPSGLTTSRPTTYSNYRTYYSTPVSVATPADVMYRDANGRTYSVPHTAYLRLSKERAAIEQEEAAISAIQVNQKAYSVNIELERTYLDRTNQYEIDAFNEKIDNLNAAHAQLKQRIDTFNRSIDAFNAELERVGTPVR
jgi:hypothetical protein